MDPLVLNLQQGSKELNFVAVTRSAITKDFHCRLLPNSCLIFGLLHGFAEYVGYIWPRSQPRQASDRRFQYF